MCDFVLFEVLDCVGEVFDGLNGVDEWVVECL